MYQRQKTKFRKYHARLATLSDLHLEVAVDLCPSEERGQWQVRGASFIAIYAPPDSQAPECSELADLLVERAGALGIVITDSERAAATRFFVKPDPLRGVNCSSLVRAVAEALAAFGAAIEHADGFDEIQAAEMLTEAARGVGQLRWLVESHIGPVAVTEPAELQPCIIESWRRSQMAGSR